MALSTKMAVGSSRLVQFRSRKVQSSCRHTVRLHAVQGNQQTPTASEKKIDSTLSSLDSLLGTPAAAQEARPAPQATPTPSTSYQQPSTPVAKQSSQQSWGASSQKKNLTLDDIMGFDGLAPELINGRAAMLGFMAAIVAEFSTGQSLFSQMLTGGGVKALFVIGFVIAASFAPVFRQVPFDKMFSKDKTPTEFGPFNPNAEIRNGRAAMLGLMALLFIEGTANSAFFL